MLKDVSFHLEDKEKAAIVGINGSGKTTLLRCILGIEEADEGSIAFSKEKKMDYLAQQHADIEAENEDYDTLSGEARSSDFGRADKPLGYRLYSVAGKSLKAL